jgi:glycosyltransferase involved in cell wall biosynthesis
VIAVSRSVAKILDDVGVRPDLVEVLHIGSASADAIHPSPLPSHDTGVVTFMYMGGLIENKGVHVLMQAISGMDPPVRLIVAGGGSSSYVERVREMAPSSVRFTGSFERGELQNLLKRADVVIAPAVGPDTSPQVILEALAARRPVIGSDIGGIPDFITHGKTGLLVAPDNPRELARAIRAMSDPKRVREMADRITRPKRLARHVDELEAIYLSHV